SCSKEVEELTLSRDVDDAFVAGNFLYAIDEETPDSLYIYNIHDPLVPTFVTGIGLSPNPLEILISGQYAYIIHNEEEDNFTVLDISDSNNPTEIANITVGLRPNEIDVSGDYAYVVDGNGDLIFVNISNPASPIVENSFAVNFRSAADVVVSNNFAYILGNTTGDRDIKVIDVSNVANPVAIDTLDLGSSPRELKVFDNYAYVIDFSDQELVIIDLTNPANLSVVSNTPLGASPREIRIANGYAFVATGNITGEFKMIDISDPLNPIIESDLSATAAASSINIFGGYAYISGNGNNLSIISIMPCDPFYVGVNGFSGDLFVVSENDNLGNHIATENIQLSNFYLSNDGDNEGILIDDNGKVSIDSLSIANAYTLPKVDGITNQVLATDGSGNLSWNTNNGAFNSGNGLTFSLNNNDDFLFGAVDLEYDGTSDERKFFFDRSSAAFRAGRINTDDWNQDSLGFASVAMGETTKATGQRAVAFGFKTLASGRNAMALGEENVASGRTATALGRSTEASGDYALAAGFSTKASGDYSTALGQSSDAFGTATLATGQDSEATGENSTAIGYGTKAISYGEVALGLFNTLDPNVDTTTFTENSSLFVIGNGTSTSNRSDALRIYKNGNADLFGALTINDAYTFPTTDGAAGQFLQTDGSGNLNWIDETLDNLGDHTATQNLELADNWISNDGENEGININDNGNVGIGVSPTDATLSVRLGTDGMEVEAAQNTNAPNLFADVASVWQSYTATTSGILTRIQLRFATAAGNRTITLYSGEGTDGSVLGTNTVDVTGTGVYQVSFDFSADNIKQTSGSIYTIEVDNRDRVYVSTANPYDGGINSTGSDRDMFFRTFIESYNTGFQVGDDGVVINNYTLPLSDGAANQVLTTDGSGSLSWTNQTVDTDTDTDDQELSFDIASKVLSIDDGNSVNLSSIDTDTNTDKQELSFNVSNKLLSIDRGNSVDLSAIDTDTDDQSLSLNGKTLNIEGGTGVDLTNLLVPVGTIQMWPTSSPPSGWLICNGTSFSSSTYPDLANVLGGTTLPNFNGRFPLGVGNSGTSGSTTHNVGSNGGEEKHTLSISEMPNHSHGAGSLSTIEPYLSQEGSGNQDKRDGGGTKLFEYTSITGNTASVGGGQAHNNMPPFYTINFIIKAE
ncbi:MAG: tail fiber protein, partial [Bacteroidota bacterium]